MAPRWPERAPRGSRESFETAQRAPHGRSKTAPRAPREGLRRGFLGPPMGRANLDHPLLSSTSSKTAPR
eukprot:2246250-Pyramimonas_sp.AAC.1